MFYAWSFRVVRCANVSHLGTIAAEFNIASLIIPFLSLFPSYWIVGMVVNFIIHVDMFTTSCKPTIGMSLLRILPSGFRSPSLSFSVLGYLLNYAPNTFFNVLLSPSHHSRTVIVRSQIFQIFPPNAHCTANDDQKLTYMSRLCYN